MNVFGKPLTLLAAILCSAAAQAEMRPFVSVGLDMGGDNLLKVTYTDGDTRSINAGDGLYVNVGETFTLNPKKTIVAAASIGWKYWAVSGENGEASLSRFPIEGMVFFNHRRHRVGLGATYHAAVEFGGSGVLSDVGTDLESNLGFMLHYDYRAWKRATVGAHYTNLTYRASELDADVDASSLGLFATAYF